MYAQGEQGQADAQPQILKEMIISDVDEVK
jgi:hypothetical protein